MNDRLCRNRVNAATPAPLSVGKVVMGAFLVPWWNRRAFARALAVPLVSLAVLTLSWYYANEFLPNFVKWLLYVLYGLLFTLFAVTCHRLVLLGPESVATRLAPRWSWRESKFLAWMVVAWVFSMAVWFLLLNAISIPLFNAFKPASDESQPWFEWLVHASKIPAFYVFARLCLVFPATAIDNKPGLKWTWNLTRGNGWRLVVVVGVLPWMISHLAGLLYRENATVFETIILSVLGIALFAVEIAALSLSYRELTKEVDA
jgi:hypothetical protein